MNKALVTFANLCGPT